MAVVRVCAVEFRLLGPFEARTTAGASLPLRRRQERSVLAVLLLEPGRVVGSDRLVELLWEGSAPQRAKATVHSHVSRIRSALRAAEVPESEARLVSQGNGYLLEIPANAVDVHRFQTMLERVRGTDDLAVRAEWLRTALSLWRGPALADAGTEEFRLRLGSGLEELRRQALAERIDADLGLGRHGSLVPELTALVGENPLRERLRGQLMLALYRSGRRADALETYRLGHRAAVDALGLPPGPELRQLEQAILTEDSSLLAPSTPPVVRQHPAPAPRSDAGPPSTDTLADPGPPPVLAQLPARIATFTGRAEQLDQLDAILARSADQTAAVVISAIAGTAGVGKTALAVYWAHRAIERFPDGQLYVNLRGFDPSGSVLPPADAVRGFLDALGVPPQRIPAGLEAQAALYRSTLTGRRVLILLDNARDADQVRPLLPGSPGCLVLVTSRNQLPGLVVGAGAHPITLDLLSTTEARQLLTSRLGAARIRAEPRAVDDIIVRCARLPLALTIVAARAAMYPRFSLAALAAELRDARGRLDAFALGDAATDARSVFSWSHRTLGDGAARLFRLLGVHPGPDLTAPAAASLAGVPIGQARTLLAELTRAHLLSEPSPGRYAFHDLLRAYAGELAAERESEPDRRAAVHRLLDHYLHTADTAYQQVEPHGQRVALASPAAGVAPERLTGHAAALAWFDAERAALLASVRLAADTGFDTHTWHLAMVVADYFDRQGHWHDWATVQKRRPGRGSPAERRVRPGPHPPQPRQGVRQGRPFRGRPRTPAARTGPARRARRPDRPGPDPPQRGRRLRTAGPQPRGAEPLAARAGTGRGRPATAPGRPGR